MESILLLCDGTRSVRLSVRDLNPAMLADALGHAAGQSGLAGAVALTLRLAVLCRGGCSVVPADAPGADGGHQVCVQLDRQLVVWDGALSSIELFVQVSRLLHKVVRFRYRGGSRPGGERLVRVETVKPDRLEGYDLEAGELQESYRAYKLGDIDGAIEVLNR